MFVTRFWRSMVGETGGKRASTTRSRSAIAPASAPRSWAGASSAPDGTVDRRRPRRRVARLWDPNPPFHSPVLVLTHHPRPPIEMEGGSVPLRRRQPPGGAHLAREAAGDLDVRIGGGATVVRDFLAADLIDTLHVVQVPILLGRGVRFWDGLEGVEERYDIESVSSPSGVTHLTFTRR